MATKTTQDSTQSVESDSLQADAVQTTEDEIALPPPLRADSSLTESVKAFEEYMLRKGFSDNTIKAFRNDLKILMQFMDGKTKLAQVGTKDLEEFLEWLQNGRGRSCSAKTLARRITTLKVFFGWIHGIGVLGTDPAAPIIQQPVRTPLPVILRDEEVSRLILAAQDFLFDRKKADARPYLLVSLLLQTGMKKSECSNLLVEDIEIDDPQYPAVNIRYANANQAHKNRRLSLDANFIPAFRQYLDQYKPENHLFECTPRNLEYVLDEVGRRAGIRSTQVGFETLRWTSAVRDYRLGAPEDRLRQKMGLSKISWRETREKILRLAGNN